MKKKLTKAEIEKLRVLKDRKEKQIDDKKVINK